MPITVLEQPSSRRMSGGTLRRRNIALVLSTELNPSKNGASLTGNERQRNQLTRTSSGSPPRRALFLRHRHRELALTGMHAFGPNQDFLGVVVAGGQQFEGDRFRLRADLEGQAIDVGVCR